MGISTVMAIATGIITHMTTEATAANALLLHLCDSGFPTGGYAHSYGLEEIVRQGHVDDEASLLAFLQQRIQPTLCHTDLPIVRLAHCAAVADEPEELLELDALAGALRLSLEARDASRRIGCRRLAILRKLYDNPHLNYLAQAIDSGAAAGHHAVVFGCACYQLPLRETLCGYYYQTMAGYSTAALKLIRIGQEGVHRVIAQTLSNLTETIEQSIAIDRDSIGWFDPHLDLASMLHEIANERLFIS